MKNCGVLFNVLWRRYSQKNFKNQKELQSPVCVTTHVQRARVDESRQELAKLNAGKLRSQLKVPAPILTLSWRWKKTSSDYSCSNNSSNMNSKSLICSCNNNKTKHQKYPALKKDFIELKMNLMRKGNNYKSSYNPTKHRRRSCSLSVKKFSNLRRRYYSNKKHL